MEWERARTLLATLLLELAWSMSYLFVSFETYAEAGFVEYALIRSLPALAYFIGSRFQGFLSDATGLKRPFFLLGAISTLISLLTMSCVPIGMWVPIITLWYLFSAYEPVMIAYLSADRMSGRASGEYYAASELGITIGTAIGGLLTDILGIRKVLLLAALISIPSIPLFWGVRDHPTRSDVNLRNIISKTLKPRFPARTRYFAPVFLLASTSISVFYVAFSIKVYEASSQSNTLMGILIATAGLLGAAFGPIYGRVTDRLGGLRAFMVSCFLYGIYFLVGAVIQDLLLMAILMIIPLFPFHYSARNSLAIELAPEERASAVSVPSSIGSISEALGNCFGGLSMGLIGLMPTMIIGTVLSLLAGVSVRVVRRKVDGSELYC